MEGTTVDHWQFYYCSSHGSLSDNVYKVPERTYILHVAPAGKACNKVEWFFDNWIYDTVRRNHTTEPIKPKLFSALHDNTFLKNNSTNLGASLGALTTTNVRNLSNLTLNYYEPGDIVSDLNLQMFNHNLPLFLQGVYEIPLPRSLKLAQFVQNKGSGVFKSNANINTIDATNYQAYEPPTPEQLNEYHKIYNISQNLIQNEMFTPTGEIKTKNFTLSGILSTVGAVPAGQHRLLIVDACRVADEPVAIRARRLSIAARRKDIGGRPRTWFSIDWLTRIKQVYGRWLAANKRTLGMRMLAFNTINSELTNVITQLNAGNAVSRNTVFRILEFIYTKTENIISASLAETLGFSLKATTSAPAAAPAAPAAGPAPAAAPAPAAP